MTESNANQQPDVLNAIVEHPDNKTNGRIEEIVRGLRIILAAEDATIPTLESLAVLVTQPATLIGSEQSEGKTAGIVVAHQAPVRINGEESQINEAQEFLRTRIREYKSGLLTPDRVTGYWQAKFKVDGKRAGLALKVPDCDWTPEAIQRPMVDRWGNEIPGLMVPVLKEVTLPVLGRMYPAMQSPTVRENTPITDIHHAGPWVKVYASLRAPNCNTTRRDAEQFAKEKGYLGGREITYILGSQAYKELESDNRGGGHYFDENGITWSWLLGSRDGGYLVRAYFDSGGDCYVRWLLHPAIPDQRGGWRFEEVKKT